MTTSSLASPTMAKYRCLYIIFLFSHFSLIKINAFSLAGPIAGLIKNVAIPYSIYSFAIDKYAKRKVEIMKQVPPLLVGDDIDSDIYTSMELRKTISKSTNLVLDPKDRLEWNKFIMTANAKQNDYDLATICGVYEFVYRSYVNFEEVNAICKSFYNWRNLLFVLRSRGTLTIQKNSSEDDSYEVTNIERFRFALVIPLTIKWYGKVEDCNHDLDDSAYIGKKMQIVWKKTELKMGNRIVVENPKVSTELSKQNWEIIKREDGMICFKRGDVGYLVYDSG
jgi:hypothetical protein